VAETVTARLARVEKPDLLISDVDGTLVTSDKLLTPAAIEASLRLEAAGIGFSLISARPPRGLMYVVGPMRLRLPFAAFNGGAIVAPDGTVLASHPLPREWAEIALRLLEGGGVDTWVFAGDDWLLDNIDGPNVGREQRTVHFAPHVVADFAGVAAPIGKVVGVSNDHGRLDACEAAVRTALAGKASVSRSQAYYLDISSLAATKGQGVAALCDRIGTPLARTAVVGDMYNDISMFDVAGLAIAMGQAPDAVKARAQRLTRSNAEDGFAAAVDDLLAL
jgi:Cof subfamily protein (haloacid dehalogenase superfamily)